MFLSCFLWVICWVIWWFCCFRRSIGLGCYWCWLVVLFLGGRVGLGWVVGVCCRGLKGCGDVVGFSWVVLWWDCWFWVFCRCCFGRWRLLVWCFLVWMVDVSCESVWCWVLLVCFWFLLDCLDFLCLFCVCVEWVGMICWESWVERIWWLVVFVWNWGIWWGKWWWLLVVLKIGWRWEISICIGLEI